MAATFSRILGRAGATQRHSEYIAYMGIEELGAWGDFIGGIAVLAGLIFVGIQLLGANKEARAATIQSALEMQVLVDTELARHSATWAKVTANAAFDDEGEH